VIAAIKSPWRCFPAIELVLGFPDFQEGAQELRSSQTGKEDMCMGISLTSVLRNPSQSGYIIWEIPETQSISIIARKHIVFDNRTLFLYLFHAVRPSKKLWTSSSSLHSHSSFPPSQRGSKACSDLHLNQDARELAQILQSRNRYRHFLLNQPEG
jgi:hypothetical protein